MYPKQSVFQNPNKSPSGHTSRQSKRDQIARLLINKFRSKYSINFASDTFLDQKLVDTVNQTVKTDEPLGEKQLVMLSRKLGQIVEDHRKNHKPVPTSCTSSHQAIHKYFKEGNELQSHASSRIHSTGGSMHRKNTLTTAPANPLRKSQGDDDIPKIIMSMTVGKGTGMSDAEWNEIVRKKVASEQQEDAQAKEKLQKQRAQLRVELDQQMVKHKELDTTKRAADLTLWNSSLEIQERRAIEEEARRTAFRSTFIKEGQHDMMSQIQRKMKIREESDAKQKAFDTTQRAKYEEIARQAQDEERQKKIQMRQKLQNLTEEDKKMRLDFYNSNKKPKAPSEASSNLITKFFKRPTHQAHELRAKNDVVTNFISEKWQLATPRRKSIEKPGDDYQARKNREAEEAQRRLLESRKKKEYEMARVLDMQVEKHNNEKDIEKVKDSAIGAAMAEDVKQHNLEQERYKKQRVDKNMKHKEELEKLIDQRARIHQYIVTSGAYHENKKAHVAIAENQNVAPAAE